MNILIFTSDIGGGHIKAAEAIYEHIKYKNLNYTVKTLNTIDNINPSFNKLLTSSYSECIKKYSNLYGKIYYYAEKNHTPLDVFYSILKSLSKKLLPIILDFKTDIMISTHPFSTQMVSYLKELGNIPEIKLINLLTDYGPHRFWISNNVDAYITASEQMTDDMVQRGVDRNIIYPIGIPVSVNFLKPYDKKDVLNTIGFNENCFTILIMSGSLGVDYVIKIFKLLITINRNLQIIIIAGRNEYLYKKFKRIISNYTGNSIKFHLLGFTKEVSKYMSVCDVIVTKPGGLTLTEAISSNIPIVFFDAMPGQEELNADFIIKNNIGMRITQNQESINKFVELIDNSEILTSLKNNTNKIKKLNFIENLSSIINNLR